MGDRESYMSALEKETCSFIHEPSENKRKWENMAKSDRSRYEWVVRGWSSN